MNFVKSGVMKFVVIFRIYIILFYIFVRYRYKSVLKNYRIFHLVVESFTKIWIIKAVPYLKVWNDSSPPPTHTHALKKCNFFLFYMKFAYSFLWRLWKFVNNILLDYYIHWSEWNHIHDCTVQNSLHSESKYPYIFLI